MEKQRQQKRMYAHNYYCVSTLAITVLGFLVTVLGPSLALNPLQFPHWGTYSDDTVCLCMYVCVCSCVSVFYRFAHQPEYVEESKPSSLKMSKDLWGSI